jgi:hypothetical protein
LKQQGKQQPPYAKVDLDTISSIVIITCDFITHAQLNLIATRKVCGPYVVALLNWTPRL